MKNQTSRWLILGLMALAQFMVVLDTVVVNVALPALKLAMHFSTNSLQWVVTAYALTFGGFLLLGGRAADLFGRRRMLIIGISSFTTFSLLIGLSQSAAMLVTLRALQGLSAALMTPAALSIVLTTFREGRDRNTALGVWTAVAAGGAAGGMLIGGVLTQYLGWRWDFFINVPVGLTLIALAKRFVPAHASEATHRQLDLPGAALVTTGLIALVSGISGAPVAGWLSWPTLSFLGSAVILLAAFIVNEAHATHPLVPLSIFRIRNVSGANVMMVPVYAGMMGMYFLISLYIQTILKFSPVMTGLSFLPFPIIIALVATRVPRLVPRFGFRPFLIAGPLFMALGLAWLVRLPVHGAYVTDILPTILLFPLGMAMTMVSLTIAATSGVSGDKAGLASGLISTTQQMGGALGLAILSGIATSVTTGALASGIPSTQALVQGDHQAFLTDAIVLLAALIVGILIIKQPQRPEPATAKNQRGAVLKPGTNLN